MGFLFQYLGSNRVYAKNYPLVPSKLAERVFTRLLPSLEQFQQPFSGICLERNKKYFGNKEESSPKSMEVICQLRFWCNTAIVWLNYSSADFVSTLCSLSWSSFFFFFFNVTAHSVPFMMFTNESYK